ncbi:NnrU family protein [Jannaschia sp. EhC01]|nr:NnrU family protein [Jannaschia sp. EhC01]
MAWAEYILAILAFFVSHSVPVRPRIRASLVQGLGQSGFTAAYSLLSLAVLAWVIGAAGRAPFIPLWHWAPWQNHLVLGVMGLVCLLLALSIARPNPFSFGGARNEAFDPARPGVVRASRHPLLLALGLWAFAHMVPNGDLAHVLLFGMFGGFAALGHRIIDRRRQRQMGPAWHSLQHKMQSASRAGGIAVSLDTAARVTGAGLLYGLLLWAHPWLFGVSPII